MWPRLKLMRDMLKPTGILAICVDHRELLRLGQMLDEPELFGQENRLAIINWQKSYTTRGDSGHVATTTEYVLVYAKNEGRATTQLLPRTEAINARYRNPDGDPRLWKSGHSGGPNPQTHKSMVYGIQHPFSGEIIYPYERNCWRFGRSEMKRMLEEWGSAYVSKALGDDLDEPGLVIKGSVATAKQRAFDRLKQGTWPRLFFGENGLGRPQVKFYLEDVKKGVIPTTYWSDENYDDPEVFGSTSWDYEQSGYTQSGVSELDAIVGKGHGFDTVKPMKLFTKLIQIWAPSDGLVMDPFAGSGTTGHAVLMQNKEAGSTRRFILIEQGRPEKGDPYARSLMADRLRRVITGRWSNGKGKPLGGGFRFGQLQNKVDAKALLNMERDEMTDAVVASHFDSSRRGGPSLIIMTNQGYEYLVGRNSSDEGFYLVWDGSPEPPVFDEATYEAVVTEAIKAGLKPTYHVYARFNFFQSDDVRFYQIPDRILMDFGVSVNDPFNNESEAGC
jgi:adenine-specific DNA-methyltransferase